ncbi:IPT/TIG domain-containing protein [Fibrella sp. HMF5335]|uniref:IPT/TIG domain-containing protein n=1 Tax=Fibrella rubiginis TaxID=2817060 RepID=A0A939K7S9_9BACT|nr:IPT/TIG domain-containing protein [Fibrella rubiginis]MBO0938965.1 IPT/TIG domain-containing protein [Fibrella rubiginis]
MKNELPGFFWCLLLVYVAWGCKVEQYPPELWAVSPNRYEIGRPVELKGAQFGDSPRVTFGQAEAAVEAAIQSKTDQSLIVIVPRVATGATQIQVANSQGMTPPLSFTVLQPQPALGNVSPANAPPGATIRVLGENLDRIQSVKFDTTSATSFTVVSPSEVQVIIPTRLNRGQSTLVITTEGGQFRFPYLVAGTPEITGFTPKRGRAGQEVVITGRYFTDGTVRINRALVDPATIRITDTEIKGVIPKEASTGRISVTTFDKLIGTSADSMYIANQPTITTGGLGQTEGIVGDKFLITGLSFLDVTSVTFGTTAATFRVVSDTQVEVTVPARTLPGEVAITLSGLGGSVSSQPFLYILPPANLTFSPLRRGKNKLVSVTGQNLTRITQVTLNGKPVSVHTRTEGTDLQFFVPTDATSGPIAVTNRAGTTTSTKSLTVVQTPVVTDYPRRAAVGRRMVLKGQNLKDGVVQFAGAAAPAVNDGRNEDTELWVIVPNDAQTGQFTVTTDAPEVFPSELFTPIRPVTNIAFTPASGKAGAEIVVTGQVIDDVTDVRFGGGASLSASFRKEATSLRVIIPANATDGTICLTNPAGIACSVAKFNVYQLVSGLAFTPKTGKTGTEITFTGQHLSDVTEVRFGAGNSSPATFRLVGNTLVATLPPDATTGTVCLTTPAGTICTLEAFGVTN